MHRLESLRRALSSFPIYHCFVDMVTSHPGVESDVDECIHMCSFGLEMIEALHDYNRRNSSKTMNLRVGINVGPVVAGVVGTKRFLYDLWGDT